MKTSEPGRQTAAAQKVSELLLDEPRQAFTITQRCGACAERLEVVEHDLMYTRCAGRRASYVADGVGTRRPMAGRVPAPDSWSLA